MKDQERRTKMLYVTYREKARQHKHWIVRDSAGNTKRIRSTQKEAVTWARSTGQLIIVTGKLGQHIRTYAAKK